MNQYLSGAILTVPRASTAGAEDEPMAGFYGNTIVSTVGSATMRTHHRPDHTFDLVGSMLFMRRTFKGTWALDGKGNICRTYIGDLPPDTTNPSCAPIVARRIGEVWKSKDGTRTSTLKAGVQ